MSSTGYYYRTREGEGGAGAVSSGGGWLAFCSHGCSRLCSRELPFEDENAHGIPFEAIPLSPSHVGGEQKRKSCGTTSEGKGADSQIFGEKGRCVARPQQHRCRLADFRRKRKSCGATSAIFHDSAKKEGGWPRIFGRKGNCVARPPEILYFFVYQYRLNAPMGEVNRQ